MTLRAKVRLALLGVLFAAALVPAWTTLRMWFFEYRGDKLLRVDFALYVAAALQGLRAGWHHLYDVEAQRRLWETLPHGLWWFPNVYTPALAVVMVPFTWVSLDAGYAIWRLVLLACLLVTWRLLAPGDWPARVAMLALVLVPYPVRQGLWMGQIIAVQMAALALAVAALRQGREKTAGILLAVIALKPQGLLLVPFTLLVAKKKKFFFIWAGAMAVIGIGVLILIGLDGARAYFDRLTYAQSHPTEFWVGWSYTLARRFDHAVPRTLTELAIAGLALFAAWRHRDEPEIAIAAGIVGSLLASPFVHLDDYMLLFPAAWLVLRASPRPLTAAVLLAGYGVMLLTNIEEHYGGRRLLLFTCLSLPLLTLNLPKPAPSRYA